MKNVSCDPNEARDGYLWINTATVSKTAKVCEAVALASDSTQLQNLERGKNWEGDAHIVVRFKNQKRAEMFAKVYNLS